MKTLMCIIVGCGLAGFFLTSLPAAELTGNLILDGGVEQWNEIRPDGVTGSLWNHLTVGNKPELAHDEKGNVLMPSIFAQCQGTEVLKPETNDVHGGKKALRLKGAFYLRGSTPEAGKAKDGDVFILRYWIKGAGQAAIHLTVYGDASVQMLASKGKPEKERWTMVEERIMVVGRAPIVVAPYLSTSAEMLVDDISMVRVIRPGEHKLAPVPADCQERVAFASGMDAKITVDGKLDEPAWTNTVCFSGFRFFDDQALLAAVQPNFRVLFDLSNMYFGVEIPLENAREALDELKNQPLLDGTGKPRSKIDTYTSRDSIELFLQAPGRSRYVQLVASLDGYRYDGAGEDGAWNGTWEFAVHAADDRWFLEMRIPVKDLGVEEVAPVEGWRLNLCCNQKSGSSTWAAVGWAFHSPGAFGKLVAQDFAKWREQQPALRIKKKAEILQAAGARASLCAGQLAVIEAAAVIPTGGKDQSRDWEAITRAYSQIDYIGSAYRCVEEDVRYWNLFQ